MIDASKLSRVAKQMVAPGKGILAADESMKTVGKRFASIELENNEDNRRAFREMLLTVPGESEYISGVILHDETIRQTMANGKTFVAALQEAGILPGIKVDLGLVEVGAEKLTTGLEGLDARLKEYVALGATFCKWRSVITIGDGLPTEDNVRQNAKDLAAYALVCQENGLVPMVEPEVLLDGTHTQEQAEMASTRILTALFEELRAAGVALEGMILKTSMVLPGKDSGVKASPAEVAAATLRVFKKCLPAELAGEAFLSGGQGDIEATQNLNAINQDKDLAWPLTFSYARALQDAATKTWMGRSENLAAAQKVFLHRAKMNSLASLGTYSSELEQDVVAGASEVATATQD